jgi:7-cyano-7-deazaguanine synthase in queuosine biosynthesis
MRVVVAMSGGVDSSVAAALLAEAGHDVVGVSMQLYDQRNGESFGSCCTIDDLHDARRVAAAIGVPHAEGVVSVGVRAVSHQDCLVKARAGHAARRLPFRTPEISRPSCPGAARACSG